MSKLAAIVCVDDDPAIRDSLEIELKKTVGDDYLIEIAEDGKEALEVCQELLENEHEIALVISDCIMPGLKGDELLKRIHALSPKTLKIMLTGQAELEQVSNAIKYARLYRYIAKPWQSEDIRLTITEALNSYLQKKKLAAFTLELQQKNEALLKLHQEKNEFLGIVAHDLKTPLSAIQMAADWIEGGYDKLSKEEVVEMASMIATGTRKMFVLIKNLLDVNVIESGKLNLSLRIIDLLPILQSLVNGYTKFAKAKNINVQFQWLEKQYPALVDENIVSQVLDNLISNAIKYSPHNKNIYVRISKNETDTRCEIQDEGPGLSEKDQQQLFGKFARLTPKPTGEEYSTGLGLFIVKKWVNAMNGKVWCESQLGKGSTFTVTFPVGV
jgi:two-component system sensor histidine kinase/response regulator